MAIRKLGVYAFWHGLATEPAQSELITVLQTKMRHVAVRTTLRAYAHTITRKYLTPPERKMMRRLFYKKEGCSIHAYALRRRAFRAFHELVNTDHSLTEIALSVRIL